MNKKWFIGIIVLIGVLLIVGGFWFVEESGEGGMCVRVDTGCCSCSNGGEEMCILKSSVDKFESEKNCTGDIFCAAVDSCKIKSCEYIDGECVAK